MPEMIIAARYYAFMKLFKNNYPRLYTKYGLYIIVPKSDGLINVSMHCIQPEDKERLLAIIDEFNKN